MHKAQQQTTEFMFMIEKNVYYSNFDADDESKTQFVNMRERGTAKLFSLVKTMKQNERSYYYIPPENP